MEQSLPQLATAEGRVSPTVLINGRHVIVASIDGSSRSSEAYPLAIAWSGGADAASTERLVRRATCWSERVASTPSKEIHGLTLERLMEHGSDASSVAREFHELARQHAIVTLVPYVDCAGLGQLISLTSDIITIGRLSALDIATAIAAELGLGEAEFAMAAADAWGRSLSKRPVAQRVEAGARMIQATLDAAAGLGLLGARTSIDVTALLPLSKVHDRQAAARRT